MPLPARHRPPACWLFCTVIDNFGDIGVSWRLATILSAEWQADVYLWLDDENALRALCPDLPALPCTYKGIHLNRWQEGRHADGLHCAGTPDYIIETFGCRLPEAVEHHARRPDTWWLNWEYLSAEAWAEAMHGKASLLADGSRKHFWLMGFSEKSGGLLREKNYTAPDSATLRRWRAALPIPPQNSSPEWLLFGYRSTVWPQWLAAWQTLGRPLTLLLAGHQIADSFRQAGMLPADALHTVGSSFMLGNIRLIRLPFVPQSEFDNLLHHADMAVVRGEDSFVRAQLAGKPFLWHIYPQDEAAHLPKLDAFWQLAAPYYDATVFRAHQALSGEINGSEKLDDTARTTAWHTLMSQYACWQDSTHRWSAALHAQPSAVEKLAKFCGQG
ncbi:elongation factor P maturation arginine rhamnosyltransferase EarP [Neisseria leonii]|uniref:elongation factor P maturation arginine rhamnosyltransferase EarP n=1 Tax=Neisseria leonii TaxID=2995413 RepID=UPI00237ABB3C|nr:elongation factor P maturation arginine rhamnosyltransferase EarP [Neisseria sp. 3986]MDD9325472.1 elongation factor P maturation arginine rhamnosyltransferase EarP [Neisseria sp. 3986]